MKKSSQIEKNCEYCEKNVDNPDCKIKRERKNRTYCGKFIYDPLKRVPKPLLIIEKHSSDEFKL